MDMDAHFGRVTLNFNLRDTSYFEAFHQHLAEIVIFNKRVAEICVFYKPAGVPIFNNTHAETVWIDFLAHNLPPRLILSL